jgi:hypothetical protein
MLQLHLGYGGGVFVNVRQHTAKRSDVQCLPFHDTPAAGVMCLSSRLSPAPAITKMAARAAAAAARVQDTPAGALPAPCQRPSTI